VYVKQHGVVRGYCPFFGDAYPVQIQFKAICDHVAMIAALLCFGCGQASSV
jgi:hypothetical protein